MKISFRNIFPTIILLFLCTVSLSAQKSGNIRDLQFYSQKISFRFDDCMIYRLYKNNTAAFAAIDAMLDKIGYDAIDSIKINTQSSPEGVYERNIQLSRQRAAHTVYYLRKCYPQLHDKIKAEPQGEAWGQLRERILNDERLTPAQKNEAVAIIDADINPGTKKWRMQRLPYYREIFRRHYPSLRNSAIFVIYFTDSQGVHHVTQSQPEPQKPLIPLLPLAILDSIIDEPMEDETVQTENEELFSTVCFLDNDTIASPAIPPYRYPVMAFRTNLLVPAFNVGIEIPIARNWSLGVDYYYPWFLAKNNKHCLQMLGLFLDMKYWFGKDRTLSERLTGHALGLYGGAGYYDFQHLKSGYQGEYIDAGIDYTYSIPMAKNKLRMEFNIGIGYIYTQARHYTPTDDYSDLIRDPGIKYQKFNFFGPTRASISLVVPIRAKVKAKGGRL